MIRTIDPNFQRTGHPSRETSSTLWRCGGDLRHKLSRVSRQGGPLEDTSSTRWTSDVECPYRYSSMPSSPWKVPFLRPFIGGITTPFISHVWIFKSESRSFRVFSKGCCWSIHSCRSLGLKAGVSKFQVCHHSRAFAFQTTWIARMIVQPSTLNSHLYMDVWWNNHSLQNGLESSNWNN